MTYLLFGVVLAIPLLFIIVEAIRIGRARKHGTSPFVFCVYGPMLKGESTYLEALGTELAQRYGHGPEIPRLFPIEIHLTEVVKLDGVKVAGTFRRGWQALRMRKIIDVQVATKDKTGEDYKTFDLLAAGHEVLLHIVPEALGQPRNTHNTEESGVEKSLRVAFEAFESNYRLRNP